MLIEMKIFLSRQFLEDSVYLNGIKVYEHIIRLLSSFDGTSVSDTRWVVRGSWTDQCWISVNTPKYDDLNAELRTAWKHWHNIHRSWNSVSTLMATLGFVASLCRSTMTLSEVQSSNDLRCYWRCATLGTIPEKCWWYFRYTVYEFVHYALEFGFVAIWQPSLL